MFCSVICLSFSQELHGANRNQMLYHLKHHFSHDSEDEWKWIVRSFFAWLILFFLLNCKLTRTFFMAAINGNLQA